MEIKKDSLRILKNYFALKRYLNNQMKQISFFFFFQHFFESQEPSIHFSSIISYVLGHTETFIPKSLSFQLYHTDEWLEVFAPRTSVLGLISSMSLDGRKVIQSVKSEQSLKNPHPILQCS